MGIYYYFYNQTRKEANTKSLFGNSPITWTANFEWFTREEQIQIFKDYIKLNKWDKEDTIVATPENHSGHQIQYQKGEVSEVSTDT